MTSALFVWECWARPLCVFRYLDPHLPPSFVLPTEQPTMTRPKRNLTTGRHRIVNIPPRRKTDLLALARKCEVPGQRCASAGP